MSTVASRAAKTLGPAGFLAVLLGVFLAVAVIAPSVLAPGDPLAVDPTAAWRPPSWLHPFGTDESGRDVYTRAVHGARASAGIGLAATAIGVGIGTVLGLTAGLCGGWVDSVLGRVFEVLFALPTLVMALLLIAAMGAGPVAAILAIGVATIPGYARVVRSRVRGVAASGYVEWARLDGTPSMTVFFRHIVPNTLWPLIAMITLGVGQAIVWVAALGFLGLGTAPPSPEWGAMLNAGRVYLGSAWWLTVMPGLMIVATAGCLTVLGRKLGGPHR